METVGERIRRLRSEKRMTLQQLADLCNITYNSISLYENGRRMPSRITAEALCDIFNCDMDYLYCKSDIKRKVDLTGTVENKITSEEIEMIIAFRKAPPNIQQSIILMLNLN